MKLATVLALVIMMMGGCGANLAQQPAEELDELLSEAVRAPAQMAAPADKGVAAKPRVHIVKNTILFDRALIAPAEEEPVQAATCTTNEGRALRAPIVLTVSSFDLNNEANDKKESGTVVLRNCCEAKAVLAADDERYVAVCANPRTARLDDE